MTWLARLRDLPGLRSWSMRPLPTLCAAAITVAALWSLFGQLEVVSHTTGRVAPDSQVRPVQHLEGGVVDRILVQEGQPVTRDQVLVTLDVTEAAANARSIQYRLDSYRIDIIRLQAELDGDTPPLIPPDLARRASETAVQALGLFTARRDLLDRKLAVQRQLVLQRRSDSAQIGERRAVNGEILKLVEEQIEISKRLLQRDVTNRMAHIELLRDRANLMRQLGEDKALAVKTAANINVQIAA